MRTLTLYTKPDCHLCEDALKTLREVLAELLAETGTDQGDTRSAEAGRRSPLASIPVSASIPESASAEGACPPASVELQVRDITREEALHRAYFERIPVVTLDGEELFEFFVDAEVLKERLRGPPL